MRFYCATVISSPFYEAAVCTGQNPKRSIHIRPSHKGPIYTAAGITTRVSAEGNSAQIPNHNPYYQNRFRHQAASPNPSSFLSTPRVYFWRETEKMRSRHAKELVHSIHSVGLALFHIRSSLNNTNNIITLREICHPVIQRLLLLLVQILPIGAHVFDFGGC